MQYMGLLGYQGPLSVLTAQCSTRMCEMHQQASVLTISATYQNVLLCGSVHAQWKLVRFRQGVRMVKFRAKLLSVAYKSNTEVKFGQAITDGYD